MPTLTDDPLYQTQNAAGLKLLNLYNPDQEAQRYQKALGNLKQTVAQRQAASGLTGSSEEKDALTNAASNFELGWAERKPDQLSKAITASNLPISNLLNSNKLSLEGELGNRKLDQNQAAVDYAKMSDLSKGSGSLANWLLSPGASGIAGAIGTTGIEKLISGGKSVWDWITGSGSTPTMPYQDSYANVYDWGGDVMPSADKIDWSWLTN